MSKRTEQVAGEIQQIVGQLLQHRGLERAVRLVEVRRCGATGARDVDDERARQERGNVDPGGNEEAERRGRAALGAHHPSRLAAAAGADTLA
jgi:hypothetical protein